MKAACPKAGRRARGLLRCGSSMLLRRVAEPRAALAHLYVMFSRATCMDDMLLLRPPPREFLERGPPASVREALESLERKIAESTEAAAALCAAMGWSVLA